MPRTLYSPRLSDDVVRRLYRMAQLRKIPMTQLADELLRDALADVPILVPVASVADNIVPYRIRSGPVPLEAHSIPINPNH